MSLNIKELPEDDRPREKLAQRGAQALTEAELLAILIGSGNTDESAVALMQRVLTDCGGSLRTLGRRSITELTTYKGMGPAKAITLLAACELGKRRELEQAEEKQFIKSSVDIYALMRPRMQDLDHEECYTIYLRTDGSIIDKPYLVSRGGLTETSVDVRVALREALMRQATAFILVHNHPSGSLRPSRQDDELTKHMAQAAQTLSMRLRDHIIVTTTDYYSYNDHGKI